MTKLYLDTLDDQRQLTFFKLIAFAKSAVLAGGTALALQIGHRKSFDFDLFLPNPIPKTLYKSVQDVFGKSPLKHVDTGDQLTIELTSGIEITFLYYWHKPLYAAIQTDSLALCDKRDIATDKAMTLGRRNAWRDYVDFFFLLKDNHVTLDQIVADAQKRFGNEFSTKLFLQQLSYTGDIADFSVTYVQDAYNPKEISSFLEKQIKKFAPTALPL